MATRAPSLWSRSVNWVRRNIPTRDSLERSALLRPVVHRVLAPELWRFTRRSVPRGVALGMVTGLLVPVAQTPAAALLALPVRANVPVAILVTFVTNPFTTPFIWAFAIWIGRSALHVDRVVPGSPLRNAANSSWVQWLMSDIGPALVVGLLILTAVLAIGGYALSALGWRLFIARKWKSRHIRHQD